MIQHYFGCVSPYNVLAGRKSGLSYCRPVIQFTEINYFIVQTDGDMTLKKSSY